MIILPKFITYLIIIIFPLFFNLLFIIENLKNKKQTKILSDFYKLRIKNLNNYLK